MLKETETEVTIVFFVTFLSLVAFQLGGGPGPPGPPSGYAYEASVFFFHPIETEEENLQTLL